MAMARFSVVGYCEILARSVSVGKYDFSARYAFLVYFRTSGTLSIDGFLVFYGALSRDGFLVFYDKLCTHGLLRTHGPLCVIGFSFCFHGTLFCCGLLSQTGTLACAMGC